jgi:hypothetical protein
MAARPLSRQTKGAAVDVETYQKRETVCGAAGPRRLRESCRSPRGVAGAWPPRVCGVAVDPSRMASLVSLF